ncbi:unnamed protein product [Enterobius vermicularis]|uniref:aralkylamine N-acetyltransferase n=1 Tax=Enterobius vermicularis TaxID=51028 RepID=A0A0N4VIZ5_ENTVE|nr:unnamed protein product [Enterobius vermicularis]
MENVDFGNLKPYLITEADATDVLNFIFADFLLNEPHSAAIELESKDATPIFEGFIKAAIKSKISYALRNQNMEVVAVRLSYIVHRPTPEKPAEDVFDCSKLTPKSKIIVDLLDKLEKKIWTSVPKNINKLLYLAVISVHQNYRRRGLAYKLMHYKVDDAIKLGCQGWITEATAYNSQKMFDKMGFQLLYELKDAEYLDEKGKCIFNCSDQTNSSKLLYLPL